MISQHSSHLCSILAGLHKFALCQFSVLLLFSKPRFEMVSAPNQIQFAKDLAACARSGARELLLMKSMWDDLCLPTSVKVIHQSNFLSPAWTKMYDNHGFPGALWCAVYTVNKGGGSLGLHWSSYWWTHVICPWEDHLCPRDGNITASLALDLGDTGELQAHLHGQSYDKTMVMSCATCAIIQSMLRAPAEFQRRNGIGQDILGRDGAFLMRLSTDGITHVDFAISDGMLKHSASLDLHPFGVFVANIAFARELDAQQVQKHIQHFYIESEVTHGFVQQTLQLLPSVMNTTSVRRWIRNFCWPFFYPDSQVRMNMFLECGHASGHGLFYRYGLAEAIIQCTSDFTYRSPVAAQRWQTVCVGGVFHSFHDSINSTELETLQDPCLCSVSFLRKEFSTVRRFILALCAHSFGKVEVAARHHLVQNSLCHD